MAHALRASGIGLLLPALAIGLAIAHPASAQSEGAEASQPTLVLNPYEQVDWDSFGQHKAALHVHTLQSDGRFRVNTVVRAYHEAGFDILSITDHDNFEPNLHVGNDVPEQRASPYPDPKPDNYPANTTWPWTDFGAPSPEELNMVGAEGNELSYQHHMNSYFNDYGALSDDVSEDEQITEVRDRRGMVILDHPGISADWWTRRPVEWYVVRYQNHPPDTLLGMEVTNSPADREKYDESLWDQLLARFMPDRPIWGFGTDDMHHLDNARDSHSVFVLEDLTQPNVHEAMLRGQFYFHKSTRRIDLRKGKDVMATFPTINRIDVDREAGTITIDASDYDRIKWITTPESLEMVANYQTSNQPWQLGRVIHDGTTLNYHDADELGNYVRIELERTAGGETYRTFTNPFGFEQ